VASLEGDNIVVFYYLIVSIVKYYYFVTFKGGHPLIRLPLLSDQISDTMR
jgi:hypothetical protein